MCDIIWLIINDSESDSDSTSISASILITSSCSYIISKKGTIPLITLFYFSCYALSLSLSQSSFRHLSIFLFSFSLTLPLSSSRSLVHSLTRLFVRSSVRPSIHFLHSLFCSFSFLPHNLTLTLYLFSILSLYFFSHTPWLLSLKNGL